MLILLYILLKLNKVNYSRRINSSFSCQWFIRAINIMFMLNNLVIIYYFWMISMFIMIHYFTHITTIISSTILLFQGKYLQTKTTQYSIHNFNSNLVAGALDFSVVRGLCDGTMCRHLYYRLVLLLLSCISLIIHLSLIIAHLRAHCCSSVIMYCRLFILIIILFWESCVFVSV